MASLLFHQHPSPDGLLAGDSDADPLELAPYTDENGALGPDDEAPPHACLYCGIHQPNSVVKCTACEKWFCNGKTHASGSHIVTHLVMARHNGVQLHEELDLGDTVLECYNCGNKNVFLLGFVLAKQDLVVVILCRLPCAQLKDFNWDTSHWQALVHERQLLPWVTAVPDALAVASAREVSRQQMAKLEAQWRINRHATLADIDGSSALDTEVLPVLMRYDDGFQYQRAFAPLVQLEADYDKGLKELQALVHIQVEWAVGLNERQLASFNLSTYQATGLRVAVGDEMVLHYNGTEADEWAGQGYVVRLPSAHHAKFTLELAPLKETPPLHVTSGFTAEFVWKGTSYDRMHDALRAFATEKELVSSYIYHKILGHKVDAVEFAVDIPERLTPPVGAPLNASQQNAVRSVLQRPLSLIQGPPGTGKTVTLAAIVYHLAKMHKTQVLVCAPSNVAVDHLAAKLDAVGLRVVRFTARLREDVDLLALHLALHRAVETQASRRLQKLLRLRDMVGELSSCDQKALAKGIRTAEKHILDACDVVCCTCVGAGDRRLAGRTFRLVLVDESTQASEPEALIALVKGAKQVVLVGDHQQLGPVTLDRRAGDAGLRQLLFERLVVLGHVPVRLEVQYRMHPCLSEFASNMFYEGTLQNGVGAENRRLDGLFPWPVADTPMMFWANFGREEILASGSSFLNRVEAMNVERVITRLFRDGVKPNQIGVITPYEGQRAYIVQYMTLNLSLVDCRDDYLEVEVMSVDGFQGREKDYIILSCVRANSLQNIGFLSDPRRLNVALTRAKYGLAVLGNPRALSRNTLWNHLLVHFREKGCLVDGPLDNLQLLMVPLTAPRAPTEERLAEAAGDGQWPELGLLQGNFASRLEGGGNERSGFHVDDDVMSVTNAFAAGLGL